MGYEGQDTTRPVVMGRLGPPREAPQELRLTHAGHSVVLDDAGIRLRLADGSAELVLTTAGVTLRSSGVCQVVGSLVRIN